MTIGQIFFWVAMDRYLSVGPGAWDAECSNLSVQIVQNGRAARAQAFEFCLDNLWGSSSGILEHLGVSCGKHGVSYGFLWTCLWFSLWFPVPVDFPSIGMLRLMSCILPPGTSCGPGFDGERSPPFGDGFYSFSHGVDQVIPS